MTQASPDTSFLAHLVTISMKVWYSKHVGLDQDTLKAQDMLKAVDKESGPLLHILWG